LEAGSKIGTGVSHPAELLRKIKDKFIRDRDRHL
jgi:hypothetical protein